MKRVPKEKKEYIKNAIYKKKKSKIKRFYLYPKDFRDNGQYEFVANSYLDLVKQMCVLLGDTYDNIIVNSRKKELFELRVVIISFLYEHSNITIVNIGELLRRDHATIIHNLRVANDYKDLIKMKYKDRHAELYHQRYQILEEYFFGN